MFMSRILGILSDFVGVIGPSPAGVGVGAVFFAPCRRLRSGCGQKLSHPYQVVCRQGEFKDPAHPFSAAMSRFAEISHGFHPAEDLFHQFPLPLTEGVTDMASGFFGQGRAAVFRATWGAAPPCCKKSTKFRVS